MDYTVFTQEQMAEILQMAKDQAQNLIDSAIAVGMEITATFDDFYLVGSFAKGTANEFSDIDILGVFDQYPYDVLTLEAGARKDFVNRWCHFRFMQGRDSSINYRVTLMGKLRSQVNLPYYDLTKGELKTS